MILQFKVKGQCPFNHILCFHINDSFSLIFEELKIKLRICKWPAKKLFFFNNLSHDG